MEKVRQITFHGGYFLEFYNQQTDEVKDKIEHVLYVLSVAERIPTKFFQHLTGTQGLYEVRVEYRSNIYRIFCCLDKGNLVVLFNGFQKKTQKAPRGEIEKAIRIKDEYFREVNKAK